MRAATNEGHLLVCVAAVTLAEIISSPAQLTSATAMAPIGRIGAYAGMFGLAQTAGQSLGPLVGTSLLDALPDRMTWPLLALFGIAAALLYHSHHRLTRRPQATPSSSLPADTIDRANPIP